MPLHLLSQTKQGESKMIFDLSLKNCLRRPARTIILTVMSIVLCFALLSGFLLNTGLQNGLEALEARMGADVMVIPNEAAAKQAFDDILLQGNPGYFYMDKDIASEIQKHESVKLSTTQLYLASLGASCCSAKVQMIGYDSETDFVIAPWIESTHDKELAPMQIYVGSQINAFPNERLMFYGVEVEVAGRLEETGTYMDASVYADDETIQNLISTAEANNTFQFNHIEPSKSVSCLLINVKDGYFPEELVEFINNNYDEVTAIQTQGMISDIASQLKGVSSIINFVIFAIWILIIAILMLAFTMISNERKKEFAILRIMGASRKKIFSIIFKETIYISSSGSIIGAIFASIIALLCVNVIEDSLSFPILLPSFVGFILISLLTVVISVITASLSSAMSANKVSKIDASLILREEN